jgi:hypothetical protein
MASSTFQNMRAALLTLISPITDVAITAYPPVGNEWTREDRVWLAGIRVEQDKLTMGGSSGARSEDLEITLIIYVPRVGTSGDEWSDVETRVETILAAIEADVRGDDTIGGTVLTSDIDSFESSFTSDDQGPAMVMEVTITAEANL